MLAWVGGGGVMVDKWPDERVPYEFPDGAGDEARWREAIVSALKEGTLRITHAGGDYYDLTGKCPRCGHTTDQSLTCRLISPYADAFTVLTNRPLRGVASAGRSDEVEIVCACAEQHEGRKGEGKRGCGWGRDLTVSLAGLWGGEAPSESAPLPSKPGL